MTATSRCPDCGAAHATGVTCQDDFHQMLFWEAEEPARGEVHHLMVLCYHLQHPGLYSPAGLQHALGLLEDFVVRGQSPAVDVVSPVEARHLWMRTERYRGHRGRSRPVRDSARWAE